MPPKKPIEASSSPAADDAAAAEKTVDAPEAENAATPDCTTKRRQQSFWTPDLRTDKRGSIACQRRGTAPPAVRRTVSGVGSSPAQPLHGRTSGLKGTPMTSPMTNRRGWRAAAAATALGAVLALGFPGFAPAQETGTEAAPATAAPAPVAPETVIARVGDTVITERDLALAQADLAEQFAQVPEEARKAAVLGSLIDIRVMAAEAEKAGFDATESFKARIAFLKDRALHNAYFQQNVLEAVTDEQVRARYDKEVAAMEPRVEISARHILVKTKEEAEAVIKELEAGKDFVELAKEKTIDPGGKDGGDLGWFGKGQMVPEFEAAAFALAKGEFTKEPVQSQFGFHVIRKEDERTAPPPDFEAVKDQVRQLVLREKYVEVVDNARKAVTIEVLDEKLKSQLDAAGQ